MKALNILWVVFLVVVFASCYEPSPLYGTWSDNNGSTITFVSGSDEFNAKIYYYDDQGNKNSKSYAGTYSWVENSLTLTYKDINNENDTGTMNTEWDVRGSMIYLSWTSKLAHEDPETVTLTLYHTAK